MAGVVITVPKPLVSNLDKTFPFDFQKFMVEKIEDTFNFPPLTTDDPALLPAQPAAGSSQWGAVQNAWESPTLGRQAPLAAVDLWQAVALSNMGWDANKPNGKAGKVLSGKMPADLVDELDDYYLWAPLLSTS